MALSGFMKWDGTKWVLESPTFTPVDATATVKGALRLNNDLGGTAFNPTVTGLLGNPIDTTAPADGYVLTWVNADAYWAPRAGGGGGGGSPTGAATGDLSGSYPSPVVAQLQTRPVSASAPSSGNSLIWNGAAWAPGTVSGVPPTGSASGDLSGTYPSPTVSQLQGRVVNSVSPTDGYVLTWSGVDAYWLPEAIPNKGFDIQLFSSVANESLGSWTRISNYYWDPAALNLPLSPVYKIYGVIESSDNAAFCEVRLYNLTDAAVIAGTTLSDNLTSPQAQLTLAFSMPVSAKLLEVQMRTDNNAYTATCSNFGIKVIG